MNRRIPILSRRDRVFGAALLLGGAATFAGVMVLEATVDPYAGCQPVPVPYLVDAVRAGEFLVWSDRAGLIGYSREEDEPVYSLKECVR